jgi:mannose-6-phosphate isomerase-like protein (cupin superfamily)
VIIRDPAQHARFRTDKMGKADLAVGEHLFCGLNCFEAGQEHEPHAHCDRDKIYLVLQGEGEVTVGEATGDVGPGDMAFAAAGVVHSMRNPGPERLVVAVAMGPPPAKK